MLLMQRWLFYFLLLLLLRSFWFSAGEFFRQKGSLVSKLSIILYHCSRKHTCIQIFFSSWETFSVGVSRRLEGPRSMIATGGGKGLDMTWVVQLWPQCWQLITRNPLVTLLRPWWWWQRRTELRNKKEIS